MTKEADFSLYQFNDINSKKLTSPYINSMSSFHDMVFLPAVIETDDPPDIAYLGSLQTLDGLIGG